MEFATSTHISMELRQERLRHVTKAQTVNLSPAMMRESNSKPGQSPSFFEIFAFFASSVDPTAEIARIRHSLSLLENHVAFRGTSSTPTQDPSSSNTLPGPIHPPPALTDPSIRESIPGIYGRHGHHGYYAGPTSAASQLLMVGCSVGLIFPWLLIPIIPNRKARDLELHPKKHPATRPLIRPAITIVI